MWFPLQSAGSEQSDPCHGVIIMYVCFLQGDRGEPGIPGRMGSVGLPGHSAGSDGRTGATGITGRRGARGPIGPIGHHGRDAIRPAQALIEEHMPECEQEPEGKCPRNGNVVRAASIVVTEQVEACLQRLQ